MELHKFLGAGNMLSTWYYAIPTRARGRMHILEVPYWQITDTDLILVPAWIPNADIATYVENRMANKIVPASVDVGYANKRCTGRQAASYWSIVEQWAQPREHYRGVCHACFETVEDPDEYYRAAQRRENGTRLSTNPAEWITAQETRLRETIRRDRLWREGRR